MTAGRNLDRITKKVVPILKEAGVTRSAFFGSYAEGKAKGGSDVDILVEPPKGTTLLDLVDLQQKLEEALGLRVDLLTYRSVSPLLIDIIQKQQIKIL